MSDSSIAIPPPPSRPLHLAFARPEKGRSSELREACLIGGFALAFCWLAAELAILFGMR